MKNWVLILIALLCGLLYLLNKQFPYILDVKENYLTLLQSIAVLAVIIFGISRSSISKELVLKSAVTWVGIAFVSLTVYSYQWELRQFFSKTLGRLVPSMAQSNKDGSVTFYTQDNDHFMIDAKVNGRLIHFLLDTGASKVTLSAADAQKLGIDINSLKYDIRVDTAKGINFAAYVKLDSIQVGSIVIKDVDGFVTKEGLSGSLLGMSFLSRLTRYEVGKGSITLWE